MVCHHCGVEGHGVSKYPKLTHSQKKQFWDDRKNDRRENANTALKEGTDHADVDKDVKPEEDNAARVKYEQYQQLMDAI